MQKQRKRRLWWIPIWLPMRLKRWTVEKNQEKHNQILESLIRNTGNQYDVLVLAQASMSVLIPCLADITKPILSSMDSGVGGSCQGLKGFIREVEV